MSIFPGAKKRREKKEAKKAKESIAKIKEGFHHTKVGRTGEPLELTEKAIKEQKEYLRYLEDIKKAAHGCQNAKSDNLSKAAKKIYSVVDAMITDLKYDISLGKLTSEDIEKIDKFDDTYVYESTRRDFIEKYGFLIKTPKMKGVSYSEERAIERIVRWGYQEDFDHKKYNPYSPCKRNIEAHSERTPRAIVQDIVNKTKENGIDLLKSNK